jgi:predicted ribosomally synthesized peptide with SipW-like signal peptide
MRKTRIIALALVVALAAVGAGFAAWTDSVKVKQVVSTGNLEIEFSRERVASPAWGSDNLNFSTPKTYSTDFKTMTTTVGNVYPGAEFQTQVIVDNVGTLPAKINLAAFDSQMAAEAGPYFNTVRSVGNLYKVNGANTWNVGEGHANFGGYVQQAATTVTIPAGGQLLFYEKFTATENVAESKTYGIWSK